MFYNRGEVLSDQFDHFKLILFWVPECSFCKKNQRKRDKVGIFHLPTSTNHNSTPKVNIFVKTKKVQKCKIKHNLFSQTWGSQTGGPRLGKNSHIFPFFFFFFLGGGGVPKQRPTPCLYSLII